MIFDKLMAFADSQTVTGGSTTASTDYANLGSAARKLGSGRPLWAVVKIINKSGGDGSDTFTFSVQTDDNTSFSTPTTIAASPTVTGIANIAVGQQIVIPIPIGVAFEQYVRIGYAVTADAVLTVDAFITDQEPYDHTIYPDAI
ncbi:MAG: Bbp16 family capsid cement protein [Phycisphaerales bacterium]